MATLAMLLIGSLGSALVITHALPGLFAYIWVLLCAGAAISCVGVIINDGAPFNPLGRVTNRRSAIAGTILWSLMYAYHLQTSTNYAILIYSHAAPISFADYLNVIATEYESHSTAAYRRCLERSLHKEWSSVLDVLNYL